MILGNLVQKYEKKVYSTSFFSEKLIRYKDVSVFLCLLRLLNREEKEGGNGFLITFAHET
ncbi:hypothetical protein ADH74_06255 [Bacteroides caecimuris]|uniref:Uncharacterized protein n=1 Tax=Bacteroides caecimuris TaxID=1796613 RepID=A0A1C7GW99_9BACE|nr:hypothetical protein A4V03_02090 [Bacteroides caecimuris]OXE67109.1 hypothetical protein ADH74_06255 [Bacteroides caecimuris]